MTDNDIIKVLNKADGLEHVSIHCGNKKGEYIGLVKVREIVDLINRQKAEIERLQEIIIMGKFTSPTAVRAQQSWFRSNSEHINRLKEEIERLKSPCEMQIEVSEKIENSIKAEAVKEFVTDVINNILPKYMQGHSEQALKISLAISERVQERVGEN